MRWDSWQPWMVALGLLLLGGSALVLGGGFDPPPWSVAEGNRDQLNPREVGDCAPGPATDEVELLSISLKNADGMNLIRYDEFGEVRATQYELDERNRTIRVDDSFPTPVSAGIVDVGASPWLLTSACEHLAVGFEGENRTVTMHARFSGGEVILEVFGHDCTSRIDPANQRGGGNESYREIRLAPGESETLVLGPAGGGCPEGSVTLGYEGAFQVRSDTT